MDISQIPLFELINRKIAWLSRNHEVLAENIANADTPNYQGKELKPLDFGRLLKRQARPVSMRVTNEKHIPGGRGAGGALNGEFKTQAERDPYEVSPLGNAVSLDQQAVLIAKNAMGYGLATSLYGKALGMVRIAVSNRR